jgi:hypothetical protein
MVPVRESNGLGVAGFFIALIGLFIPTGIVALLGLLISLVALGRQPRGFAAMGVIIGLFGTVIWLVITGLVLLGGLAAGVIAVIAVAAMFVITQPEILEVTSDMFNVTIAAVEYQDEHGKLPEDLGALGLSISTLTDPWGNPYRYRLVDHDPGFDVMSNGGDGAPGTSDDVALSSLDRIWEDAFENFGEKMEEFGQRMERLEGHTVRFDRPCSTRMDCDPKVPAKRYEAAAIAAAIAEAAAADAAKGAVVGPFDPPEPEQGVLATAPGKPASKAAEAPDPEPESEPAPAEPGEHR